MFKNRLWNILTEAERPLFMGIGGGHDVFTALPLFYEFAKWEKPILANLTFTDDLGADQFSTFLTEACLEVKASNYPSDFQPEYFPEFYLSQILEKEGFSVPIYTLRPLTIAQVAEALKAIIEKHSIDAIFLVDGGYDSLCFGDEENIASFTEDMMSLYAASHIQDIPRYLVCTALNVETELSKTCFYQNISTVQKQGGFLGTLHMTSDMDCVQFYEKVHRQYSSEKSIINSSIVAAINGQFGPGNPLIQKRIEEIQEEPFINCLTSIYWFFDFPIVFQNILYDFQLEDGLYQISRKGRAMRVDKGFLKEVEDEDSYGYVYCGRLNSNIQTEYREVPEKEVFVVLNEKDQSVRIICRDYPTAVDELVLAIVKEKRAFILYNEIPVIFVYRDKEYPLFEFTQSIRKEGKDVLLSTGYYIQREKLI